MWRNIPLGAAAPVVLVLIAAILWSGVWYFETAAIGAKLDEWRRDSADRGLSFTCASEGAGGYPFRLSFDCADPVIDLATRDGVFRLTAARLSAVALIYDPEHLIIEIDTPASIVRASDGATLVRSDSGLLRASAQVENGEPARLSTVAPAVVFAPDTATPVTAQSAELHLRLRQAEAALDVAVKSQSAVVTLPDGGEPIAISGFDLIAVVNNPPRADIAELSQWPAAWQAAGGVADIKRLALEASGIAGEAAGVANLTPQGHVEGALNARLRRIDKLAETLVARGVIDETDGQILRGAVGLLAGVGDGKGAISLPVRIRDGEVYLGPIRVWTLPPLT